MNKEIGVFNAFMQKKMDQVSDRYSKEDYQRIFKSVDELFTMMSSAYGNLWINNFENDNSRDIWVAGLIDLSVEEIANGFENCLTEFQEFPPNLPKFRKMCLRSSIKRSSLPLLSKSLLKIEESKKWEK